MYVFALILAVLAAVVLINTARFTSKQIPVEPAPKVPLDEDLAARRLGGAIRFKTISHQDPAQFDAEAFLGLHRYLRETFPGVHAALRREVIADYSLLFTWQGSDASRKPILLMSHLDVVPVEAGTEEGWTYPAFEGRVADGRIWGRGTMDVKHGVMGMLEAVERLLAEGFQPSQTVYLAFGHDEEVGGWHGAAEIAAALQGRGVRLEYVLDEGSAITDGLVPGVSSPVALVNIAEKGYLSLELSVVGEGGHSSTPPPKTAVGVLATAIHRLESHPLPAELSGATALMFDYLGPEMPFLRRMALANRWMVGGLLRRQLAALPEGNAVIRTTAAATMIEGGMKENVLPTSAKAVVNFRILPGDRADRVLTYARRTVNDSRVAIRRSEATHAWEPSALSSVDSPAFATLQRTIREVFPGVLVAPGLVAGATDSRHYAALAENTFRFMPMWMKPGDMNRIHGTDERLSVDNYADVIRFFIRLIRESAAPRQRVRKSDRQEDQV